MSYIVIVDDNPGRAEKLAQMLRAAISEVDVYMRRFEPERWEKHREGDVFDKSEIPNIQAEMVFIHYTNEKEIISTQPKLEIWYGGNGIEKDKGKQWNIHFSLSSSRDVEQIVSIPRIIELWEWAINPQREGTELPYLLRPPASIEYLSALFILCQGYLAAHADSRLSGWDVLVSTYPEMVETACNREEEIKKPSWWLSVFGVTQEWKKRFDEEIRSLKANEKHKVAIEKLFEAFEKGGEFQAIVNNDVVYRAYDALRALLGNNEEAK